MFPSRIPRWSGLVGLCLVAGLVAARSEGADEPPVLSSVREAMRTPIEGGEIAGAVTLVATPDRIVHLDAQGYADRAADRPMRPDTIFWIASMTKPITATAVMMLQDRGELSVDDPVAKYLPEFEGLRAASGRPVSVTIRHLLTHTAGLAEISAEQARDIETLEGVIPLYVAQPVKFEPGTRWVYSQSAINTAGRIVEVVSGRRFEEFLRQELFEPLCMEDTTFYPTEDQSSRLAVSYRKSDAGELEAAANPILYRKPPTSRDRFPAANGGLYSTAPDYARFLQMILNRGTLDGRRYLGPEAVDQMTTLQTGELATGFTPGNGWGLGWCVVREPQGVTAVLAPGSFGHGGAHGTQAWVDPRANRIDILMVQRADFPNSDRSVVRQSFEEAAATALKGR